MADAAASHDASSDAAPPWDAASSEPGFDESAQPGMSSRSAASNTTQSAQAQTAPAIEAQTSSSSQRATPSPADAPAPAASPARARPSAGNGPLRAAPAGAPATRFSDRLRPRAAPVQAEPAELAEAPEDLSPPHDDDGAPPWLDVPPPSDEDMSVGPSMMDGDLGGDFDPGSSRSHAGGAGGDGIYLSTAVEEVTLVPTAFGERWASLVPQLGLNALARELALQAECVAIDDQASPQRWQFRVERESLRQPALQDKLQAALSAHLDAAVQLEIEPGRATDSPALRDTMAIRARQRRAETIILEDPEVQQLLSQFKTARILPGSIKPL